MLSRICTDYFAADPQMSLLVCKLWRVPSSTLIVIRWSFSRDKIFFNFSQDQWLNVSILQIFMMWEFSNSKLINIDIYFIVSFNYKYLKCRYLEEDYELDGTIGFMCPSIILATMIRNQLDAMINYMASSMKANQDMCFLQCPYIQKNVNQTYLYFVLSLWSCGYMIITFCFLSEGTLDSSCHLSICEKRYIYLIRSREQEN